MARFIISADSSCDHYKSYLAKNNIHCLVMKRVLNGKEISELYDTEQEFSAFYETLKSGDLPTTVAINPYELNI